MKKKLTCNICSHRWIPRRENPVECPRCRSRKYNKPVKENDGKETTLL